VRGGISNVKVAFHADQLSFSAPGGIGTYVRELLDTFAEMADGPELVAITTDIAAAGNTDPLPTRHPIDEVRVKGSIRRLYPSWDLFGKPALPRAAEACDVVHATNHAAVPPAAPTQALIVTVHDLAFDMFPATFPRTWRWLYRLGVRAAARRATSILVPSEATSRDLQDRYDVAADRIVVTPLAASAAAGDGDGDVDAVLERLDVPKPYVLCPATLEARKNQARLVRAYRQVAPDVPHALVLAGPAGWRSGDLEVELRRPGPGRIVRTGRLDPLELDAVMRGADLVAYPSLYEGFGLPIVEAMQRGVPVVTSTAPACAETAGGAALLVDPDDVGGLAEAIARVLTDPAFRDELVAKGRERAASFSWAATARATLDAYRAAVARAPR
jgi:glycosyltransferase involved in cell wall biosynthesis